MRKLFLVALLFTALLLAFGVAQSSEKAPAKAEKTVKHEYVGAKKCKTCHKVQYKSWLETKHAKAYDVLSAEEKKKPECTKCHITGTTAKGVLLEGVQCEACHGPGKDYKSPKIMSKKKWKADPDTYLKKAKEAGLIIPTEKDCVRCHTKEGNPHFKPFDFEKRKDLVHTMSTRKGK